MGRKDLWGQNDKGGKDQAVNAFGAKQLGGGNGLGRNVSDSAII